MTKSIDTIATQAPPGGSRGAAVDNPGPVATRVRTRSHWFRQGPSRTPEDLASVAAFIIWRQARQCLQNMRKAGFSIDVGEPYFDFLAELTVFLIQLADRFALNALPEQRGVFTPSLVRHLAEHFAGNWSDLMRTNADADVRGAPSRLIEHYNLRIDAYADMTNDVDAMRLLADHLIPIMAGDDAAWAHAQVMEYEGPALIAQLRSALANLLDDAPRQRRTDSLSGE